MEILKKLTPNITSESISKSPTKGESSVYGVLATEIAETLFSPDGTQNSPPSPFTEPQSQNSQTHTPTRQTHTPTRTKLQYTPPPPQQQQYQQQQQLLLQQQLSAAAQQPQVADMVVDATERRGTKRSHKPTETSMARDNMAAEERRRAMAGKAMAETAAQEARNGRPKWKRAGSRRPLHHKKNKTRKITRNKTRKTRKMRGLRKSRRRT